MKKTNIIILILIIIALIVAIFLYKDNEVPEPIPVDQGIEEYLETNLAGKEGKTFCSFAPLEEDSSAIYLSYLCQDFKPINSRTVCEPSEECAKDNTCDQNVCIITYFEDVLGEVSGSSGPIKLLKDESGAITGHWMPRDGSYFTSDLRSEFGEYAADLYYDYSGGIFSMEKHNQNKAKEYFNLDFQYEIVEVTEEACTSDYDCETPGNYLIRSSCPYQSWCIDDKCTVVCPQF